MGKKDRDRQKRLQRKRAKRDTKRVNKSPAGGSSGAASKVSNPEFETCVFACDVLFTDCCRLDDELRQALRIAMRFAGGVWLRLPLELEAFLCDGAPWSLTCADLEPARRAFIHHGSEETFDRLTMMSLTNEPDAMPRMAALALETLDCTHAATMAFDALRTCLDHPGQDPGPAIAAITHEIKAHDVPQPLVAAYQKLMRSALLAVHAPASRQAAAAERFARHCRSVFDQGMRELELSLYAWWACVRLFLREVFDRLASAGHETALAADSGLLARILDPPEALFWAATHGGSIQPLRTVLVKSDADAWLRFLRRRIDPPTLPFEDRVRYEIARLKMLRVRAKAMQIEAEETDEAGTEQQEFLAAFDQLLRFLTHGVPPANRSLPGVLQPLLVEFYIAAIVELDGDGPALQTTEALLRLHEDDYRLACLYATGALVDRQPKRLALLKGHTPQAHVDAELFARCAAIWESLPRGANATASIRALLFDPFDREHRKHCLTQLARQALRRAVNTEDYFERLRGLMAYFDKNSFVFRELREKTALESELIFLASLMAPLHNVEISLTESQSQQWVSHGRAIAAQSSLGTLLFTQALKSDSRWFTLAPSVRSAALSKLEEESQRKVAALLPADMATPTPGNPAKSRRRRRKPRATHPQQPGLFDDLSP